MLAERETLQQFSKRLTCSVFAHKLSHTLLRRSTDALLLVYQMLIVANTDSEEELPDPGGKQEDYCVRLSSHALKPFTEPSLSP